MAIRYSTTDGFIGEVSVSESNFMGRGQYVKLGLTLGQRTRGIEFNFTEPYFLDTRIAAGFDLYAKKNDTSRYAFYNSTIVGGGLRFEQRQFDDLVGDGRASGARCGSQDAGFGLQDLARREEL